MIDRLEVLDLIFKVSTFKSLLDLFEELKIGFFELQSLSVFLEINDVLLRSCHSTIKLLDLTCM